MKTTILTLTAVAILGASAHTASAGDREWATAGKILTGVVAGAVIAKSFEPVPTYTYAPTTYYSAPVVQAPTPVYVQPAPVYFQPAPVVVYSQPYYVQTMPMYVHPAPVYVAPAPGVSFHFDFGHRHYAPPVYRVCR